MKRILVLVTVVALMVVMTAMSVAPAFAQQPRCPGRYDFAITAQYANNDFNGNSYVCLRIDKKTGEYVYIDDRYF